MTKRLLILASPATAFAKSPATTTTPSPARSSCHWGDYPEYSRGMEFVMSKPHTKDASKPSVDTWYSVYNGKYDFEVSVDNSTSILTAEHRTRDKAPSEWIFQFNMKGPDPSTGSTDDYQKFLYMDPGKYGLQHCTLPHFKENIKSIFVTKGKEAAPVS